ncbi:hypothetical protein MMC18_008945 [Xylographa bjoerkii]|nr:hypothetical protein [Xylographa bjoerkii]
MSLGKEKQGMQYATSISFLRKIIYDEDLSFYPTVLELYLSLGTMECVLSALGDDTDTLKELDGFRSLLIASPFIKTPVNALLLSLLPNVQKIYLNGSEHREPAFLNAVPLWVSEITKLSGRPPTTLQSLMDVSMHTTVLDRLEDLAPWAAVPSVRGLACWSVNHQVWPWNSMVTSNPKIEKLRLDNYKVFDVDWPLVLRSLPALKSLAYGSRLDSPYHSNQTEFQDLADSLTEFCGKTLEELHFFGEFPRPEKALRSLHGLRRLKMVSLQPEMLTHAKNGDTGKLVDILPPSVECIHVTSEKLETELDPPCAAIRTIELIAIFRDFCRKHRNLLPAVRRIVVTINGRTRSWQDLKPLRDVLSEIAQDKDITVIGIPQQEH